MKHNILLLTSTAMALCLFASPSKIMLLLEMSIFLAVALTVRTGSGTACFKSSFRANTLVLALVFDGIGIHRFAGTLSSLGLGGIMVYVLTTVCGLGGAYAFFCLACWMDERFCYSLGTSIEAPVCEKLRTNWLFPISAAAYFFLEAQMVWRTEYLYSVLVAVGIAFAVACRSPSLLAWRKDAWQWRLFYMLNAAGICWAQWESFPSGGGDSDHLKTICAMAALFFVYVWVRTLWCGLRTRLNGIFSDIRLGEWILYGVMLLLTLCFITFAFLRSDAFYGTEYPYDIIYTSDSHVLIQQNVYLGLTCPENDLRQPLFAVFAAPFLGAFCLIGKLLRLSPTGNALLLNYPQILILFLAYFLLSKILKLTGWRRAGFLMLLWLSYPTLLFSLMIEQYIIAFFFLILLLYSVCAGNPNILAFCGASGTLLTSAATLPLLSQKHPVKNFPGCFRDLLNGGLGFVIVLLGFGRLEILLNAAESFLDLNRFAGGSLSLTVKFCRYTAFVSSCLTAPEAGIRENMWENISWQLVCSDTIHWAGIGIVLLCFLSAIWNRKKKISVVAAGWIGFSFLVLCVLGWGTQENGLILYALYFGWAFPVLLYQLVEKIENHCRIPSLTIAACAVGSVLLAVVNLPAIWELLSFAIATYPL